MRKQFTLIVVGLIIAVSVTLAGVDASLKDDVFTMIKQTRKIVHTMLLMDTSEQMNNFAYSDYLNTCADTKHKLNSSHAMCMASYHQCRDAENNAACSVDLGCDDILGDCTDLLAAKTDVTAFCDDVALTYPEPSLTDKVANPLTDSASKKYVGPWNPREDYKLDLCFYNWTDDTGGDVVAGTNSRHPSNDGIENNYDPEGDGTWNDPHDTQTPPTDRRDWDCM
ncbi:hypothetical protein KAH37_01850, partial [bacterium]|nr:hypothetical protein [bacterium]